MRIVQKGKKPKKNLPLSQAGRRAVLSCHRQRRRGALALVAVGHRVAAAQSAARATSSPPWRARRSPACSPQLVRRRPAAAPGPAPCSRVAAPGPAQGAGCRGRPPTPWALGLVGSPFPAPSSRLPPSGVSQLAPAAARCTLEGAFKVTHGWGLARTAATGLHATLLPPLAFCRGRAVDFQARSREGS